MKLGIIGSGKIGSTIGAWAARVGYKVHFSAKNIDHAKSAANLAGINGKAGTVQEVVDQNSFILLAVPYNEVQNALAPIREALKEKILIDVTNPLTAELTPLSLPANTSAAEEIAKLVPEAHVVKAFNYIFAEVYASQQAIIHNTTLSGFFAGDDPGAKAKVHYLITKLGLDPIDAGTLANAKYLESLAAFNIHLSQQMKLGTHIGFALAK